MPKLELLMVSRVPDERWQALQSGGHLVPTVPVDELRLKFGLLRKYLTGTSWDDLAGKFGAPVGTVKFWGHGSARRQADQMPDTMIPTLMALFASILPPGRSHDDLRRLVLGPAARLEEEIRSAASASLAAIIAREGKTGTAVIFQKPRGGQLVELDDDGSTAEPARLTLNTWFRIEFPIEHSGTYAITLQHTQRSWAVVPCRASHAGKRLLVPRKAADTTTRYMRERHDVGSHRFVCLQAARPFPASIDEHEREGSAVDKRALEELAARYEQAPASQRSCQVLTIEFELAHE